MTWPTASDKWHEVSTPEIPKSTRERAEELLSEPLWKSVEPARAIIRDLLAELDLYQGLLIAEQEDCENQRKNKVANWEECQRLKAECERLEKGSKDFQEMAFAVTEVCNGSSALSHLDQYRKSDTPCYKSVTTNTCATNYLLPNSA